MQHEDTFHTSRADGQIEYHGLYAVHIAVMCAI